MPGVLLLIVALFALSPVACGESSDDSGNSDADAPPAAESSPSEDASPDEPKLTATAKETHDEARIVCGLKPAKQIAQDFGMTTSDPDTIAKRYARGYWRS
jgi:hypothetical protein